MKRIIGIISLIIALQAVTYGQINMRRVEKDIQAAIDLQDLQMHDRYTESYLKKAREDGQSLAITRNEQDPRKLYILGDFYLFRHAQEYNASMIFNTYVHPRADQSIFIRKSTENGEKDTLVTIKRVFPNSGFKLETYDPLNQDEGMVSFVRKQHNGSVVYLVLRAFKGKDGNIYVAKISRTLGSYNLTVMRGIYQALKITDTEILTEHFIEKSCLLGEDCY